jgi:hypothetical protein
MGHSVRSFFSASHPSICLGTFSTVSSEMLKIQICHKIEDYNQISSCWGNVQWQDIGPSRRLELLVCTQEGVKKPFYRRVSMDSLSWVILIPLRNLFVPVSPECLEKAPHILRFFLLDIQLLFSYSRSIPKRVLINPKPFFSH